MNEEKFDPYYMLIKPIIIHEDKNGKERHRIMISQSSDFYFAITDGVNEHKKDGFVTMIRIPPDKMKLLRDMLNKAIENYKKTAE